MQNEAFSQQIFKIALTSHQEIEFKQSIITKEIAPHWAIARRDNDEMIGECGFEFWFKFHNRLELAYHLNPDYWQKGIMTNALACIFKYAYDVMEVNRIEAFTIVDNPSSQRVLEKLGFTHEGTLKQYRFYQGAYQNIEIYAHLRDQYVEEHSGIQRMLRKLKQV